MTIGVYKKILFTILALGIVFGVALSVSTSNVRAEESAADLRTKISDSQRQLEEIEKEIQKYEAQLNEVGAEKKTLQSAIRQLDLSRQKIQTSIRGTEQKISSTDLEIEELEREIRVKELEIARNMDAVAASLRAIDEMESQTIIELALGYESISDMWDALEEQATLQLSLRESARALGALKTGYEQAKDRTLVKRGELGTLKTELSGERSVLTNTIGQKDTLLTQTKNEEASYQRILAEKKAAREQFEKAMAEFEAKLKFILDPSSIPSPGSGVLRFPFEPAFIVNCASRKSTFGNQYCLTQYFGNTAFAQSGAYSGKGHNGIDFGVSQGTKVTSALGGTVVETGNTDAVVGCYSYGKWILVRHGNGLSTLYAHLSAISVQPGQNVSTGQLLGYSGNTGYSTGPHLHFTVYATEGVNVVRLGDVKTQTNCAAARIPVAGFEAYLNPLNYL